MVAQPVVVLLWDGVPAAGVVAPRVRRMRVAAAPLTLDRGGPLGDARATIEVRHAAPAAAIATPRRRDCRRRQAGRAADGIDAVLIQLLCALHVPLHSVSVAVVVYTLAHTCQRRR